MKAYTKTMYRSCLVLAMLLMVVSCEDYLERTPEAVVSEDVAFQNFQNFQGFTEELYMCIPNFTTNYWTTSFNWGDDEIQSTGNNFHFGVKIENGDFWGWQAEHDGWGAGWLDKNNASTTTDPNQDPRFRKGLWPLAWYGIRKANIGLANLDRLTDATAEERALIEGQLLFFRGWFHFELIQYFGGLPYIDQVLPADEPLREPRLSYHESAEKAAEDFRRAADLLPIDWNQTTAGRSTLGKNDLRINKIMALAYLGKNLLWAGSPLMNYESTGSKTYNAEYCKRAAEAFGELLALVEGGQTQYALLPFEDYHENFYTTGQNWRIPGGTEAIFRAPYFDANASNWGISKQYLPDVVEPGNIKFLPTANYVNYYGMANGLPLPENISQADPVSGYDPNYPWRDRDPRFYNDIVYDGVMVVQGSMGERPAANKWANMFTGGSYRDIVGGSRTGYANRKFIPISANEIDQGHGYSNSLHIMVPYMRLADIYLMYAEAALMAYGSSSGAASGFSKTAEDAINVIRERAGVAPVAAQFLGSPDAFLPEVRRERAVELAFESHRFNDLRRWLLLAEEPYTIKTSIEFNRPGPLDPSVPASENRVVNLTEKVILTRDFTDKHYWLPLKVADVNMYPEFYQNPGW